MVLDGTAVMEQLGISPTTVTIAVQVLLLPVTSVTVKVTVLLPMLEQLKLVLETLSATGLQISLLALFTLEAVMVAAPFTNVIVTGLHKATGAVISRTVIVCTHSL